MNLKDRIIEIMKKNSHLALTSNQVRSLLGKPPLCSINRNLKDLVEGGFLTKNPDPVFPKRMLYRIIDYSSSTQNLLIDYSIYRCLLIHINKTLSNTEKSRCQSPELAALNSLIEKFLNKEGKELFGGAPDDVIKKMDAILTEQILPLLRTPVLETTDASAVGTSVLDPSTKEVPETELTLKAPIPGPSKRTLELAFPKGIPGSKKAPEYSEPDTTSYKKSRSKVVAQKEARIEANPFGRHVRYYMITPEERNYQFAQAWYKIIRRFFPAYRLSPSWCKAFTSLSSFRAAENFRNLMRNARVEADLLCCRYEDYMIGIAEYYFERNASCGRDLTPKPQDLAGEAHVSAAKDYLDQTLKGKILITKDDIRHSGHADFILNYGSANAREQNLASIFYHDVLFDEIERAAALSGHRLFDLVTYAITYGLLPQSWAEGYQSEHSLKQLSSYRFPGPVDPPGAIFRHIQE